jgi:hypothetical protein
MSVWQECFTAMLYVSMASVFRCHVVCQYGKCVSVPCCMSVWQACLTAVLYVSMASVFHCHTDILPHTRGDILADNNIVIARHQDIPKLPGTQIIKLSGYSIRCLARNTSSSVAVSNVCSSKQHVSDSPKSPWFTQHLSGWRHFLPHTDVPAQGHNKANTGAIQFRPSENQRPPDHSPYSSIGRYATFARRRLPPIAQRAECFETLKFFPPECQLLYRRF